MKNQRELFSLIAFFFSWSLMAIDMDIKPYDSDVVLVKFKSGQAHDFLTNDIDKIGSRVIKKYSLVPNLYLLYLPPTVSVENAITLYNELSEVEYVEPDYYASNIDISNDEPRIETNDPQFSTQWALNNTGQSGGTVDADINAVESWIIETGSQTSVIGIIDSGVDYNHTDLNANLWTNSGEIAGNSIDDDGNGYVDDVYGINAITGSGNPLDDFHHGTRAAGIIGAVANNALGITGVMNIASIASCKFLNSSGTGTSSDAIECMEYFTDLKSRFYSPENIVAINNSWILNAKSQAMQDAITALRDADIIFIAAAGNAGTNNDTTPTYPANYPVTNIISVAATDRNDLKPSFSNFGKATVHVAAPGSAILSTIPNSLYGTSSGTSLAAPHVTGLVGLLISQYPGLTWYQIKNLLIAGGEELANLQANTMSGRRIRGADVSGVGSLTCMDQIVQARMAPLNTTVFVAKNSPLSLKALHIVCDSANGDVTLYDDGVTIITLEDSGINGDDYADDGVYGLNWIPTIAGDYALDYGNGDVVNVRVYDPSTWHGYNVSIDGTFTSETFTGTSLGGGDEAFATLTSPFPIKIGGDSDGFNILYISSNGAISFTDPVAVPGLNTTLPTATVATLVAPFWDDLNFTLSGAGIYYQVLDSAPNRKLVIEWRTFKHFNVSGTGVFQVIFYENTSNFRIAYKDTDLGSVSYNSGKSATVGVQLSSTLYTQYSYLTASVPSNRSLLFTLQP